MMRNFQTPQRVPHNRPVVHIWYRDEDYDRFFKRSPMLPFQPYPLIKKEAAVAYVTSAKGSGTTSAVVTTGAVTDGDVMYAVCIPNTGTPVPPAGWTTLSSDVTDAPKNVILARKVASSEGTTQTFTAAGAGYTEVVIYIFSGADTTTPEDCASSFAKGTAGTPAWGTITTVTANTMNLLLAIETGSGVPISGFPAGYTTGIAGDFHCNGAYKTVAAIGAISGLTGTSAGGYWGVYSIAVRPASGGGGSTTISNLNWMS